MKLDQGSEMIIFELILTTFEATVIFKAAGAIAENGWAKKRTPIANFILPKSVKHIALFEWLLTWFHSDR